MKLSGRPLLILDFDTEARPLSWYGGDFVTKDLTAIAWQFLHWPKKLGPICYALGKVSAEDMLLAFLDAYNDADMVTGHFIRGYDLPVIQAALAENGLDLLGPKLTHDTKNDLLKMSGVSKSQENLAAMLGVSKPKIGMNQAQWREANRLTDEGIEKTIKRVKGDVVQHIQLRQKLMEAGLLGRPRVWTPSATVGGGKYAP